MAKKTKKDEKAAEEVVSEELAEAVLEPEPADITGEQNTDEQNPETAEDNHEAGSYGESSEEEQQENAPLADLSSFEAEPEAESLPEELELLIEELAGSRRRRRQDASHIIANMAREDASCLHEYIPELIDALYRPEAQTRWEVLDALSELVLDRAAECASAYDGAEAALFDEGSATVRLAAFRYLSRYGSTQAARSDEVWSILDEAVQIYHGDAEYRDMLTALLDFARGDISEETRACLVERVVFDAENSRGYVQSLSSEIVEISKERGYVSVPAPKKKAEALEMPSDFDDEDED